MGRLTKHFILRNMVIIIVLLAKPSVHCCFGHKAQVGSTLSSQKNQTVKIFNLNVAFLATF